VGNIEQDIILSFAVDYNEGNIIVEANQFSHSSLSASANTALSGLSNPVPAAQWPPSGTGCDGGIAGPVGMNLSARRPPAVGVPRAPGSPEGRGPERPDRASCSPFCRPSRSFLASSWSLQEMAVRFVKHALILLAQCRALCPRISA